MKDDFLIVRKQALPDYFEKVVAARRLIQTGQAADITEATRVSGISRSTYYKYRDSVFEPSSETPGQKAVFSLILSHEKGVLSAVLAKFSSLGANILTIMQSPPIGQRASVVISVDLSGLDTSVEGFTAALAALPGVERADLLDIE